MNASVSIDIHSGAGPGLAHVLDRLRGAGRRDLIEAMVVGVQEVTAEHLRGLAGTKHDTANRLGAKPTGHLAQAAEKAAVPEAVSVIAGDGVEGEGTLTIRHPGLARAFGDVTIRAKNAGALTIPVNAAAYGRRAGEMQDLVLMKNAKGNAFLARPVDGDSKKMEVMYLLVRSVTQKQDRTLLPSQAEWEAAARKGAAAYIQNAIKN